MANLWLSFFCRFICRRLEKLKIKNKTLLCQRTLNQTINRCVVDWIVRESNLETLSLLFYIRSHFDWCLKGALFSVFGVLAHYVLPKLVCMYPLPLHTCVILGDEKYTLVSFFIFSRGFLREFITSRFDLEHIFWWAMSKGREQNLYPKEWLVSLKAKLWNPRFVETCWWWEWECASQFSSYYIWDLCSQ